jgi:malate dehydrogenase (oxaloacetate-decarboxylating)
MATPEQRTVQAAQASEDALRQHRLYRGKIQMTLKCPVRSFDDFAIWYTPGVAAPCREIAINPDAVYDHTNKGNLVAVISDGTRVLGLGDIGPRAGLPVMEGKALLFKYLGGVDAVPICLDTKDPDEIVRIVRAMSPSFGAINLEDIAQPKCFGVLDALRSSLDIPVWHDDQQGTATVVLAGLVSALRLVGKDLQRVKIAMVGMGAANVATYRLLKASGVDPGAIVACDSIATLHRGRADIESMRDVFADKWRVCVETNAAAIVGGTPDALAGADVCIAFSTPGPGVIDASWIGRMARDAIVFACANPVPEIWPWEAHAAGARIVATGRSDFPNQVNNSLVFPGFFRGVLDVRARAITDRMAIAAADQLVKSANRRGANDQAILPPMDDIELAAEVAAAAGMQAQVDRVARRSCSREHLRAEALRMIAAARQTVDVLTREGLIAPAPLA